MFPRAFCSSESSWIQLLLYLPAWGLWIIKIRVWEVLLLFMANRQSIHMSIQHFPPLQILWKLFMCQQGHFLILKKVASSLFGNSWFLACSVKATSAIERVLGPSSMGLKRSMINFLALLKVAFNEGQVKQVVWYGYTNEGQAGVSVLGTLTLECRQNFQVETST